MITVKSIKIVDQFRTVVATLTDAGWVDPHGGTFDERDQQSLTSCACQSDGMDLILGGRTIRHPKVYVTV